METGPRGSEDAEEDASLHTKDEVYAEAERVYNETVEEEAASIIDACIYGGGVATDNDVRVEVATDITSTSGGPATLHAPFLETTAT